MSERKKKYNFTVLHEYMVSPVIKETILSTLSILGSFVKYYLVIYIQFISGLLVMFHWSMCFFFLVFIFFDYYNFVKQFETMKYNVSCFVLSQVYFSGSFEVQQNFSIALIYLRKAIGILQGIRRHFIWTFSQY